MEKKQQQQALRLQQQQNPLFDKLKGSAFFRFDTQAEEHRDMYRNGKCSCFTCQVGWARKNDVELPFFEYERTLLDTLEHESKYILVRKSAGLGLTTLFLRWMAWLCLKDDAMKGKEMAIVVGTNLQLAIGLIDKVKSLFLQHGITFDSKATSITLNGCQINAYPSNHLDALRSRMDLKVILIDELEFFEPGERAILRDVVERYIGKSNPYIIMVSTPGFDPNTSLMKMIEQEQESIYRKFVMDYTVGLGKIYSETELSIARLHPSKLPLSCREI
jgi:hypothetical protein